MSYTFPSSYSAALNSSAVEENYLIQLYYDDEGSSDFTGISFVDSVVSSIAYYGVINDVSDLSERIDLRESKASASNITIYCNNTIKNTKLSTLMFSGTYEYINRKVKIYSQLNGDSTLTNCLLLFEGKTVKIDATLDQVIIEIEAQRPWDKIVIPQLKSSISGNYQPLAYGDFVQDTNTNFYTSKFYYPMPREYRDNNRVYFLCQNSIGSGAKVYFWDENLDRFVAFDNGSTATVSKTNGLNPSGTAYYLYVPNDMQRTINFRPTGEGTDDFSATSQAYDEESDGSSDESTAAVYPSSGYNAETSDATYDLILEDIPEPVGRLETLYFKANAAVHIDGATSAFGATPADTVLRARYNPFGSGAVSIIGRDGTQGDGTSTNASYSVDITTAYDGNTRQLETTSQLEGSWDVEPGDTLSGWVRFYDAYYQAVILNKFDSDEAADASENYLKQFTTAFCGDDGLDQSFTDGSGLAELPHEILRDLLARFTDFDYGDSNMEGWSALDTVRSGWTCHWWTNEAIELKEVLEKLQYEGCFIFLPKTEGGGGRFIYVASSYDSADIVQTFDKNDYSGIRISTTDLSELATNYTFNYQKHPATGQYIQSVQYGNSTERTNWNIGTNENKITKNLDFITADVVYNVLAHSDANDCVALYYDNIVSQPKIIVEFDLVNLKKSNIQVGDIVTFNDTDLTPFGKTWGSGDNSLFFMVTEIKRGLGSINIIAREVYDNLS